MDVIERGDTVTWTDWETGLRSRGRVIVKRENYYIVGNSWRGVIALKPNEITKECG